MSSRPYTYFYAGQIRRYLAQFMRVFTGLQVRYGNNDLNTVPVVYGLPDRVVAARLMDNGTFVATRVPLISVYLTGIEMDGERRKAPSHKESVTFEHAVNGKQAAIRAMGIPYKARADVHLYASNTDQMLQMKEQILMMFNPSIAIQVGNGALDWSYLTKVTMDSINNDTTYPMGEQDRLLTESISFTFDFWLNFPVVQREGVIETVIAQIKDTTIIPDGVDLGEVVVDETGRV